MSSCGQCARSQARGWDRACSSHASTQEDSTLKADKGDPERPTKGCTQAEPQLVRVCRAHCTMKM